VAKETLIFTGSASWVIESALDDVSKKFKGTKVTVNRTGNGSSGTFTLDSVNPGTLRDAVNWISHHGIYRHNLKKKVATVT
jgi:hypothetical protein